MPFVYELTISEQTPQPAYTLQQQLVPVGTLVGTGQNLAILSDGSSEFHLRAPLQGLVVEWFIQSGEPLSPNEAIARIVAEGSEQPVFAATPARINPC